MTNRRTDLAERGLPRWNFLAKGSAGNVDIVPGRRRRRHRFATLLPKFLAVVFLAVVRAIGTNPNENYGGLCAANCCYPGLRNNKFP
jgi:hypothetical protein